MPLTISDMTATTLERYSPTMYDNVLKNNVLLYYLQKKGNVRLIPGGHAIRETLQYAENDTFTWYNDTQFLDVSKNNTITAAIFPWKQANANVVISGREERENSDSDTRMYDLIQSRIEVCEKTMQNKIGAALFNKYTAGGLEIDGLQGIIPFGTSADNDPKPATGDLGGIDTATNPWWCSYDSRSAASTKELLASMSKMFITLTRGVDKPKYIVCNAYAYGAYESALADSKRFVNVMKADGGFTALEYNGIPVFFDVHCPTNGAQKGTMYFINDDYLFFKVHKDANFKWKKERLPYNQDMTVFPMIFMGNMTSSNRSLQGVMRIV